MDLKEFRIAHSIVMEHYQFIEMHLEGIYAALTGESFYLGLKEVERYSINKIIIMIQEQEKRHNKRIISDSEYEDLKTIYQRRNFWTHDCYTSLVFDRKTEGPKKETDIKQLIHDTRAAEQMRDLLFEKKIKLMEIVRDNNTF
ncbi:MAG: hypothetical protein HDR29_04710 [Lachnospiraceae bacterium]|nr:hypothetical protein [Lachnospiraceae bacterium]